MGTVVLNGTDPSLNQYFAIVSSGMVTNMILATGNFLNTQLIPFDYAVAAISMIRYTYDSTSNTFAPPTPPLPTLPVAIAENIAAFQTSLQAFVDSSYGVDTRMNFIGLYINAQINGLTNRMAYIAPLLAWQNAVIEYAATYVATVSAMTSVSTVMATAPDFSSLQASNPNLTPIAAIQITS
jgi:hypothetical protein